MTDRYFIAQVRQDALAVKNKELKRLKAKLEEFRDALASLQAEIEYVEGKTLDWQIEIYDNDGEKNNG